ncbi:MAG: hypothetical protein K2I29_03595, partial [Clostridia bacterium]|nr:hypothetical protein [Clostridia bacterium]
VLSITYKTDSGSKTLTSECDWDVSSEEITKEEYDLVSNLTSPEYPNFGVKLTEFKTKADVLVGKTYSYHTRFREDLSSPKFTDQYYKRKINGYTINYVKVKFVNDGSIEINYDGETTKVLPISYEVKHFEN